MEEEKNKIKILQVADRAGWAVDKLSKPISEIYDNVDMSYMSISENRYLDSGYSPKHGNTKYSTELGNKYDIVHFHRLDSALHGLGDLQARKILHIHTERKEAFRKEIGLFDDIICPTRYAEQKAIQTLKVSQQEAKVYYVPHGIDLKRYSKQKPDKCEIGYVGRIIKHKRYPIIQKACYESGIHFIGCGYVDQGELRNIYNIPEDAYEYNSFLDEQLMLSFYNRMSLLICLSEPNIEVGPLPVMEAMASGVPVISTKIGWAKDNCINGENIIFIEESDAKDSKKLVEVIKRLIEEKGFRENLSKNALELIKDFSIEKYAERIMEIYEKS